MRIFHIADLHIGKLLYNYNLLEDQKYVLEQILESMRQEKPDVLLIAGDVYDRPVPSAEAVQLFDWFLTGASEIRPRIPILMISGNHDSAQRLDYAREILKRQQIYIAGIAPQRAEERICQVTLSDAYGPVHFYLLPFVKPGQLRRLFTEEENERYVNLAKESGRSEYDVYFEALLEREKEQLSAYEKKGERCVLLTHQFFTSSAGNVEKSGSESITVGTLDNIDTSYLQPFSYVAMGHIHRGQKSGRACYRYAGTPMAYAVSEEKDEKGITDIVLSEKGTEPEITSIPLTPLRRVRALRGTREDILQTAMEEGGRVDDYVSITLTDEHTSRFLQEELNEKYAHILELRFDNSFTRELTSDFDAARLTDNFTEMFAQFFSMRNGRELDEEERQLLGVILQEAEEEMI